MPVTILQGDCLDVLRTLPDQSVHCCVTSPPYWGLRDYGTAQWEGGSADCDHRQQLGGDGESSAKQNTSNGTQSHQFRGVCGKCGATRKDRQIGLEATPEAYVAKMVEVFREVRRVLRDDGTCWINLGDSYSRAPEKGGSGPGNKGNDGNGLDEARRILSESKGSSDGMVGRGDRAAKRNGAGNLKPKDLVGIPWRVAMALQAPYYTGTIKDVQDRIWLAAMIDGEGGMFIHKRKAGQSNGQGYQRQNDSYGAGLEVANTHESIVQRCLEITGMGSICFQDKESKLKNRNQRLFRWNLRSNQCRDVVREIYPFLVGKQHEARLLLGCPPSGPDAEKAHASLINLHNGFESCIDFPAPSPMFAPGWYLRSDIIWHKCNPMPESVTDRPTKAHEYIFLLSKSERYWYDADAIKENVGEPVRMAASFRNGGDYTGGNSFRNSAKKEKDSHGDGEPSLDGRNKRSVWTVATAPYSEAHFATFPPDLIKPCILAGCPAGGTVLDCFGGSGTTGMVALELGRNAILIELNPTYCKLIDQRTNVTPGLALC